MWPWPKNFKIPPLYLLFPQNQFSESMAPRLKRERGCGCRNLAKSFIAFFGFIAIFVFHRVFSNQDGPSRFFPALGFRRKTYLNNSKTPLQSQHCAGFPDNVLCDFLQFCFGRLRNATHSLLSLDFLIGVSFCYSEISDAY